MVALAVFTRNGLARFYRLKTSGQYLKARGIDMKASKIVDSVLVKLLIRNAKNNGGKLTPAAEKFRKEAGIADIKAMLGP